jgi:hypothetical protein
MQPQALVVRVVLAILGLLAVLAEAAAHRQPPVLLAQTALAVVVVVEHLLPALRVGLVELAEPVLNFPLLQAELQVLAAVLVVVVAALALPVLVALERSAVATVVVAAVVAVVSLLQATAGMVRKAQSSLNIGTLLGPSTGLVALALGMPQVRPTGLSLPAVLAAQAFPAWAIMWYSMPALTAAQVLL